MEGYVEGYASENAALRRKLQSKAEAVLILSKDLSRCRNERDQYKVLVEELQDRLTSIRKNAHNKGLYRAALYTEEEADGYRPGVTVAELLRDAQKRNKALRMEMDDIKQQLSDAYEDMEALRLNYASHRCGSMCRWEGQAFPNHPREELIQQLETLDTKCTQLQINLQALLDEREEFVQEQETYKFKVHRLNYELSTMLKGKNNNIDIDALITENRYLHERLLQTQEELVSSQQSLQKYKAALDLSNKSATFQGKNAAHVSTTGRFISQNQVRELLEAVAHPTKSKTPAFLENLRNVCQALFDSLEDKSLRLAHQKKANRILAKRIVDLEILASECGTAVFPSITLLAGYSTPNLENVKMTEDDDDRQSPKKTLQCIDMNNSRTKDLSGVKSDLEKKPSQKNGSFDAEECQPLPPSVQALVEQALEELRQEDRALPRVSASYKDNL